MIQEPYRSDVGLAYVIRGNSVVLKCDIPPFIADFVSVLSWQDETGSIFPSMSTESTHGICKLDHMHILFNIYEYIYVYNEYVSFNLSHCINNKVIFHSLKYSNLPLSLFLNNTE